jgi:hypothetical protein
MNLGQGFVITICAVFGAGMLAVIKSILQDIRAELRAIRDHAEEKTQP